MLYLPIDAASAGDNTILAAVGGARIHVHNYVLVADGAVGVTWKSGSTELSGAMSIAANGGIAAPGDGHNVWMRTEAGEDLILNLSDAVQVSGHIVVTV